jgi:hypothetical protein
MSLNVSAMAVLHITDIPLFPGYMSFATIVDQVKDIAYRLSKAPHRI